MFKLQQHHQLLQHQQLNQQQQLRQCTTTTINAICMWYHFTRLKDKAFQGMSPQQFWMVKASTGKSPQQLNEIAFQGISRQRLNDNIPGHKPPTMHEYEMTPYVYQHTTQQQQQRLRKQQWCLNYLEHTTQLRQQRHNNIK